MIVPKLRFKEFTDEYSAYKLKDKCEIYDGTHETPKYTSNGVNFVSVEDIKNLLNSNKYISREDFEKYKIKPRINDVFMTRIGDIGTSAILNKEIPLAYYVSLSLIRCKNESLNASYLNKYISCYRFQKELNNRTIHVAFPKKINTGEIGESNIIIPNDIKEQTKIADFLSLLDEKINLQTKKIEDLKLYKLYMQSKLLSENISDEVCISQLGSVVTGTTPSKSENSYWENGEITWITPSDINDKRDVVDSCIKLTNQGLKKGKFIPKNSVLVTCIASIGKNAILKTDGSCNQQINAIIPNEKYNYNYIYYLVENISKYMQSIAGTSATSIINREQFSNLIVKVHSKEWQDKIDVILSVFETKTNFETEKLNKINELKKGLMQKMFV